MFNPLHPFSPSLLDAFIQNGKKYFVRQTYPRGLDPTETNIKGSYLITHYDNITAATQHFNALANDPNRFLYDWSFAEHKEKLEIASSPNTGYKVFAAVTVPEAGEELKKVMAVPVRHYIDSKLGWYGNKDDTANYKLFFYFGELYLRITLRNHEVKVALSEVEKFYNYVL